MMAPPEDFKLNIFLVKLGKKITDKELQDMKDFMKGAGGIGRWQLEHITTVSEFWEYFQVHRLITINNIVVLQALVWHLGRDELYRELVEFAADLGNTIYTCDPQPEPVNGYKHMKFHLKGDVDKDKVQDLISMVSLWMCVPKTHVLIAGVQPSESWVITLMVPDIAAELFPELAKSHKQWFSERNIDTFEMEGEIIDLTEGASSGCSLDSALVAETSRNKKRIADLEEQNRSLWNTVLQQKGEVARLKANSQKSVCRGNNEFYYYGLFLWSLCYINMVTRTFIDGSSLGVELKNGALAKADRFASVFRRNMIKIRVKNYDRELIEDLLEAFRRLVIVRLLEEIRLSSFLIEKFNMRFVAQNIQLNWIGIPTHLISILRNISGKLTKKDRAEIIKKFKGELQLSTEDVNHVRKAGDAFLETFLVKHIAKISEKTIEYQCYPEKYIASLLEKTHRKDLVETLNKDVLAAKSKAKTPFPSFMESPFIPEDPNPIPPSSKQMCSQLQ